MAYIHNTSFEIVKEDMRFNEEYFTVDDLLALTIQTLNTKGYTTRFSCEGHMYKPFQYLYKCAKPFPPIICAFDWYVCYTF